MEELEKLKIEFTPIIQGIINDNAKFYQFTREVKWQYLYNEDFCLIASCDNNLVININIAAISFMQKVNQPLVLEFMILHEIRHLYQRLFVSQYHLDPTDPNYELAMLWMREFNNYESIYKDRNHYYHQCIEFDAYSFSYAAMLYKHGEVDYIFPPEIYKTDDRFHNVVEQWISYFKNNNL